MSNICYNCEVSHIRVGRVLLVLQARYGSWGTKEIVSELLVFWYISKKKNYIKYCYNLITDILLPSFDTRSMSHIVSQFISNPRARHTNLQKQITLVLTFCWPCISVYLYQNLTNLMHKILFHNKFYFMPVHVSSTCACIITPIGVTILEAV